MPDAPTTAPRTLHCANASLYAGFTIVVCGASLYVGFFRDSGPAMQLFAAVASTLSIVWGGYYVLLRYEVDATGITRCLLGRTMRINWADLTSATLKETHTQETASAVLHLQTASASLKLGSDLLALDDVLELAREIGAESI